jgi:hypothetical protein
MVQLRCDLDLEQEAVVRDRGGDVWLEDLYRDIAPMLEVLGKVDRGHAAATELAFDHVAIGEYARESVRNGLGQSLYRRGFQFVGGVPR